MEDRRLLSTFDVTSSADDGSTGTLRWAVAQANAASSPSTIDFKLSATPATITLTQGQLELSNTSAAITIDGPGAGLLSISGDNTSRVLQIDENVTTSLSGLTITGGSATGAGGGLYNSGTATLTDCTITGNTCIFSAHSVHPGYGGLDNVGTATLTDCTISNNTVSKYYQVGGLGNSGTATLTGCTISGNFGRGLSDAGTATLTGCTISDNTNGGGLINYGTATLTDCTISGNSVERGGGGLYNSGAAALTDCTISGNIAAKDGGGVVATTFSTTLTLTACTISGNSASNYGGLWVDQGTAALIDTIVAGNSSAKVTDIGGNITGSYNLIGAGASGGLSSANHNRLNVVDPGLAPLASNGGPTKTMALLPGSPAIGAGTALNGITTDQRGQPLDSPPDIGAYQTQSSQHFSLSFSGLTSPSIIYGTASVTLSGTLASGSQAPQGESLAITLDGVSHQATIGAGGAFSITFNTSTLGVSVVPYTVGYSYAGDAAYGATTDTSTLTIDRATPTLSVSDTGGTFIGRAFPASTTISGVGGTASAGLEGVTPTLAYYAGTSAAGAPLAGPPVEAGTYTVVASFPGSADYSPARSAAATFTVAPAVVSVALTPQPVLKKHRVVSVGLSVQFGSTAAGTVPPSGMATFEQVIKVKGKAKSREKVLGTAPLVDGRASLSLRAQQVLNKTIEVIYPGDADYRPATVTLPVLTSRSLQALARAIAPQRAERDITATRPAARPG